MKKEYQKLEYPKIIQPENDLNFIIATHIDISMIDKGILFLKGDSYDYEDAIVIKLENKCEIVYNTEENSYHAIDNDGNILD